MTPNSAGRPLIGLQNSVMAFVDPLQTPELSYRIRRTGEGVDLPVQDGEPTRAQFFELLETFCVDFLLQHTMPYESEQLAFIDVMAGRDMKYLLGNEFGSINRIGQAGTNRGDFTAAVVDAAKKQPNFMGLLYDETEHIQLHPNIYKRDSEAPTTWQWADPSGKTLDQIENAVSDAVAKQATEFGCKLFDENVFPVMYHAFARGGMNPVPKVLKEEYQSLQLASALGAAVQYGRMFGICVDLWGSDAGPWFTRMWGFPGHSPEEFKNALQVAWHFAPDFLFVENVDPLARYSDHNGFALTEFGEIFREFIQDYVPNHPLPYRYSQAMADVALVRSDDALFDANGGFSGHRMYGSHELDIDSSITSIFRAWHLLSHGHIPASGPIWLLPDGKSPKGHFPVTAQSVSALPLEHGVNIDGWVNGHDLFYPMNSVLVFDQHATSEQLAGARMIVAAGSRMTDSCAEAMLKCACRGTTLVSAPWLMPSGYRKSRKIGNGHLIITECFNESDLLEQTAPLLGSPDVWRQRFGNYMLEIRNASGDGIHLDIHIT